ncbi:MAG TPA: bifunctional oligoribonuclease/PAP phosphatase NrnA [Ktedonobacterales bacterium]|nr:bifunctional oligoribonuclease/PAP phosphatase NrnA [Ktedonobacterales bacterium]
MDEGAQNQDSRATQQQAALAQMLAVQIDARLAAEAWRLIAPARRVLILAHEHPDPDALGSALGLAFALEPLGKRCVVACADPAPADYTFLPGHEAVVTALPDTDFDLVIALDAGELSRYGRIYFDHQAFFDSAVILNMDHHVTTHGCGLVNVIDPLSAATAELLTLFLLNRDVAISEDAAKCLLAGIITDTRAFEYDATTARTLAAGAYLRGLGAIPEAIIKPMYRLKPLAKARLWGRVLDRELRTAAEGRIVYAAVRQGDLAQTGATPDMDDGLSSYLLDITGVRFSAILKEQTDGTTKASLRALAPYDAAAVARHFGGGGHLRAAGCTLKMDVEAAVAALIPVLERALDEQTPAPPPAS